MREVASVVLIAGGVSFMLLAAIGLLRLPDALCRSHAVAKAMTLGILLILLGTWAGLGNVEGGWKLGLAILFQVATIPVASQLLADTALILGIPRWREGPVDRHDEPKRPAVKEG